jgi:hypothetical protein
VPRSARLSRPSTSERTRSNSARSAAVKNSWFAYLAGRCNGVVVSSVQMPCRSGSPHAVFGDGAGIAPDAAGTWADAGVVGAEMIAAAAAMATIIIEPENLLHMMISLALRWMKRILHDPEPMPTSDAWLSVVSVRVT